MVMISGIDSVRYLPGHGILGGAVRPLLESMVKRVISRSNWARAKSRSTRSIWESSILESSRLYFGDDFERASRAAIERSAIQRLPSFWTRLPQIFA